VARREKRGLLKLKRSVSREWGACTRFEKGKTKKSRRTGDLGGGVIGRKRKKCLIDAGKDWRPNRGASRKEWREAGTENPKKS